MGQSGSYLDTSQVIDLLDIEFDSDEEDMDDSIELNEPIFEGSDDDLGLQLSDEEER